MLVEIQSGEVQWLIIAAFFLMLALVVSCLVFAWGSTRTEAHDAMIESNKRRLDDIERRWEHLRSGMKRAGAWRSEYDAPSPLRIKDGSA